MAHLDHHHHHHHHDSPRPSPAENIATTLWLLLHAGSAAIRQGANLARTVYGAAVWGDAASMHHQGDCCGCSHHTYTVECRPAMHHCCHCCY